MARAAKKVKEIQEDTIFYDSLAQGQQLFLDGEITMAVLTSSRATLVSRDTDGRVKINWSQGQLCPVSWPIIKGGPGGKQNALKYIAFGQDPVLQSKLFETIAYSPSNPAAMEHVAAEYRQDDPFAHFSQLYWRDEEWYAANYGSMIDSILETIA
ncbi:extracellular solute-binding protein [Limibacillus halophilus]|uniref:Spermidine/putrescine-binding protein n=1 Tax=Limibacillus halophilus TaxID=1579333 RepID=A0A839SQL2_9PROT|nr:extracellular solute-binding protein [Limibacillus halophilus]MBB3064528.1 spermidine/putrescine-binding protein [Limibacillus halophilus]